MKYSPALISLRCKLPCDFAVASAALRLPALSLVDLRGCIGLRGSRVQHVRALQIFLGLSPPNQPEGAALDEHFGGATSRIVVGSERHSISTGAPNGKQVSGSDVTQRPVMEKAISCFANRPPNVSPLPFGTSLFFVARHFGNRMNCPIQRGPHKIVHGSVYNHKALAAIRFRVGYPREQHGRLRDNRTPGLQ